MPVASEFNLRSGGNKFLLLAQALCRLTNASAPIIRARYSDRAALIAVLDAAVTVCSLLPAALDEQATMDAMTSDQFDPADTVKIPGQDTV